MDAEKRIEEISQKLKEAEARIDQIVQNAVTLLTAHCAHHKDLDFDTFLDMGGNACPLCLKQTVHDLEARNTQLVRHIRRLRGEPSPFGPN